MQKPRKRSERTLKMMERYPSLRAEGLGPAQIAEMVNLSPSYVRSLLSEISEQSGIPRDSLLMFPHNLTEESREALSIAGQRGRGVKKTRTKKKAPAVVCEDRKMESQELDFSLILENFNAIREKNSELTRRAQQSANDRINLLNRYGEV